MIAYSGFVNDNVRQKCNEVGFQTVIEAPLTCQKITEIIFPLLEMRERNVDILMANSSNDAKSRASQPDLVNILDEGKMNKAID